MSYNFEQAFHRALLQMKEELNQAFVAYSEKPRSVTRRVRYETYESIVGRLDCLL